MSASGRAAQAGSGRVRVLGWVLVGFVIWLAQVQWPIPSASPDLDSSWQQALSYALAHGMHFGRDIVFTFGPLGGPAYARYEPGIFWVQILLFEGVLKGLLAWRWTVALKRMRSIVERAIVFVLLLSLGYGDAFWFATLLILAADLVGPEAVTVDGDTVEGDTGVLRRRQRRLLVLDLLLVWAIGFVKFTFFALATGVCVLVVARAALESKGPRSKHRALQVLALAVLACVAVWIACGQNPLDLPLYVARSAELAAGYTESQAQDGNSADVRTSLASLALLATALLVFVLAAPRARAKLFVAAAVVVAAWVAFRASFTSHGERGLTLYAFLALAPCVLVLGPETAPRTRALFAGARVGTLVLAIAGFTGWFRGSLKFVLVDEGVARVERTLRGFFELPHLRAHLEADRVRLAKQYALPRTRAIVGSAPIDFVGNTQAWIFLNDLTWKPRPVFQSYAAATAGLIELNGAFFESAEAPPFVLCASDSIDVRMPWMEDSAVRFALLKDYVPVTMERGLLLLRRDPQRAARPNPPSEIVLERDLEPGEILRLGALPGDVLTARIDVRYSFAGRLRRLVYHAPATWIELRANDGVARDRRFVPGMARTDLLLRPAIEFEDDWVSAFTGGLVKRFQFLRLRSQHDWSAWYEPTFHVTIRRCDGLLPVLDPTLLIDLVFGSFATRPVSATGTPAPRYWLQGGPQDGRELVIVGAPAQLVFEVRPGPGRLVGNYGVLSPSLERDDGIDFHFALVASDGTMQTLLQRTFDRDAPDIARSQLDLPFDARAGDQLVITTSSPPGRSIGLGLAYFEALEIR